MIRNEKKLKEIAAQLKELEREYLSDNNVSGNLAKMEKIISDLSLEELFKLDELMFNSKITRDIETSLAKYADIIL